ncbi:MAG: hypothetical protein GDA41_00535 [Rhodospirillales bacterium]|nr:hypothetical protein [Rhodospirillales bacterium]
MGGAAHETEAKEDSGVFGISFPKFLVLGLVIVGIIVAFRLISVMKRQQEIARRNQRERARQRPQHDPRPGQRQIEDMAACARCGAYIAAEAGGCGRKDCPFGKSMR